MGGSSSREVRALERLPESSVTLIAANADDVTLQNPELIELNCCKKAGSILEEVKSCCQPLKANARRKISVERLAAWETNNIAVGG